jgi:signal transduction histidine kinase
MMVGAASVLAARIEAFAVFITVSGLPVSVRLLLQADAVHVAMGFLAVVYTGATLITAWRVHRTLVVSLGLRFKNQGLLASLQRSGDRAEALAVHLLSAQDEATRRVSRELHDGLNQAIGILLIDVELLKRELPSAAARNSLQLPLLASHIQELADDLRRIVQQLHPAALERLGLVAALQSYCAEFSDRNSILVRFRHNGVSELMSPEVSLCLYRIAQEALQNAARHSGSRKVTVVLLGGAKSLHLLVRDFGIGFQPDHRGKGLGLLSMEERVRLVGGNFSVNSPAGKGTRIKIFVPLSRESSAQPAT